MEESYITLRQRIVTNYFTVPCKLKNAELENYAICGRLTNCARSQKGGWLTAGVGLGKEISSTDFSQLFLLKIAGISSVFLRSFSPWGKLRQSSFE